MGLRNGDIISETMTYQVKTRVFFRKMCLPFFRKRIIFLVGYRKSSDGLVMDDYVSMLPSPSWIDPLHWFTPSGHVYLTRHAMKRFRMSKSLIKKCVKHALNVDKEKRTLKHFHFMPHTKQLSEQLVKECLNKAALSTERALYWLGTGLHVLQDKYAHFEQNAGFKAHLPFGPDPDNPEKHPYEYWRAYLASQEYIMQYLTRKKELSVRHTKSNRTAAYSRVDFISGKLSMTIN
ncbi:MAG: hypothetical protein C4541_02865 [Candidatus Auribacter fodinae]|uniref:Phospholipase C/D domain-containing protein n=1 Tax=Candidatus Auribacter fodinae TaxID=2093366 RepID=A0A3A4R7Q8_9BACT|nr:MAG: hypothetical protein C4541_02865 [Candidatus Auribacter fodinae]